MVETRDSREPSPSIGSQGLAMGISASATRAALADARDLELAFSRSPFTRRSDDDARVSKKKRRTEAGAGEDSSLVPTMSLFVRWYSPTGKTKVNHLVLKPIDGIDSLEGISKDLVARAFPEADRPDYILSTDFYKFTPMEEFMSLPGDISKTEFRLVASHNGYEFTVLERELGAHRDPERKMLVTVIEFESTALMIGHLGVRVSLISYPVVSIKKAFLDNIQKELRDNPDFKGMM